MSARRPERIEPTGGDKLVKVATTVLQEIPVPGTTSLAAFIENRYADHLKRTIEDFRQTLIEHAQDIEQLHCSEERLFALLNDVSMEILKTASRVKRQLFRDIILNFASGKPADEHFCDACVQMVTEATELQLRLLDLGKDVKAVQAVGENGKPIPGEYPHLYPKLSPSFPDIDGDVLLTAYLGIMERGLVRRPYRGTPRSVDELTHWHLVLTPFAQRMIDWIAR